ncbi:hypothetical protein [Corynebacterium sp. HS2168-gen11]|uniref:hypothetical protein n=1 Tax=Corynebacterium sp. HS2168-gen11 TaxID=2974027 RepID=UPI00216B6721|nr:hypothetical protein [Corynebacterium sp. HS2168-gen11]MCS4535711.1 hypothetical protein [Corynebacterium sp. HS2168-gen11]
MERIFPNDMQHCLDALKECWQGQPDLSFMALIQSLEAHGMQWDSPPAEIAALAYHLAGEHPASVPLQTPDVFEVRCMDPVATVTIQQGIVVYRQRHNDTWLSPTVLQPTDAQCTIGERLRLENVYHGEVVSIRKLYAHPASIYLGVFDDDSLMEMGPQQTIAYRILRREITRSILPAIPRPLELEIGQPLEGFGTACLTHVLLLGDAR